MAMPNIKKRLKIKKVSEDAADMHKGIVDVMRKRAGKKAC
jgi:hypothetical protein